MRRIVTNQGFVSLFTTIMISLLLLVVTVSMISLESLQLRKAEDSEQTIRAYYAAEAGVEDAVSKVLSGIIRQGVGDNVCNNNTSYDSLGAAGWTCQQVSFSGSPEGQLKAADAAKTIDPGDPGINYHSVIIEWGQSSDLGAARYTDNIGAGFQDQTTYAASYSAPPIELSIAEYPRTPFAAGDPRLKLQNLLVYPGGARGGITSVNNTSLKFGGPQPGDCRPRPRPATPAGDTLYNCYVVLDHLHTGGSAGNNYLFRIRSRYLPTYFKMMFCPGNNGGGCPNNAVQVPDGTATIDVTAKAGQTYRRVISKLPLNAGAAAGLNFVMYSDTNICKDFDVIDNVAQPGCPY